MLNALLAAMVIAGILVLSEILYRRRELHGEYARKFVHVASGTFIAFLPYWVDYRWIQVLAVGFIGVTLVNRFGRFFGAIHTVARKSWGDVLFGVAILACAFLQPPAWLFTVAILQVALADGLAAVVGSSAGKKARGYTVLGCRKTLVGTATFALVSMLIYASVIATVPLQLAAVMLLTLVLSLTLVSTALENLGLHGLDNLTLPLVAVLLLGTL